jgi:hypothetical protein
MVANADGEERAGEEELDGQTKNVTNGNDCASGEAHTGSAGGAGGANGVDSVGGIDALVCLHGANGSEYAFRRLLPRVAAATGVRCIAFDRPPYGLSSRPTAGAAITITPTASTTPAGTTASSSGSEGGGSNGGGDGDGGKGGGIDANSTSSIQHWNPIP